MDVNTDRTDFTNFGCPLPLQMKLIGSVILQIFSQKDVRKSRDQLLVG